MQKNISTVTVVSATFIWLGVGLAASNGQTELFAQEKRRTGALVGVVIEKGLSKDGKNGWVEVKADGEEKGRRYWPVADPKVGGPDRSIFAAIRKVETGVRVRLEWVDAGDGKDITSFEVLAPQTLAQDFARLTSGTWVKERVEGKVTFRTVITFGGGPGLGPDSYKDVRLTGALETIMGKDVDSVGILWRGALAEEKGKRFLDIAKAGKVFYSFEEGNLRLSPESGIEEVKSLEGTYTLKKKELSPGTEMMRPTPNDLRVQPANYALADN